MITEPGAAMLDSKVFVSRLNGPFPDLYERWWDGAEWIWVNHGRPEGVAVRGAPGAAMLDQKLFVVIDDGRLFERHWRSDLGRWAWEDHGRPENRTIVAGPGAAMLNEKLFVVVDDGRLFERHWRADLGRWAWEDHGRPENHAIVTSPGAAMLNQKLFVGIDDGRLFERHWRSDLGRWAWEDHGTPPGTQVATAPGAALLDTKLFVGTANGHLFERFWNGSGWVWVDHGTPPGSRVATAPGAAMMNSRLFVGAANGHLFQRRWRNDPGQWVWDDHGAPPGTRVATAPGAAMMNSKLFVGTENSHLFEFLWNGTQWMWVDHGTAFHDQSQHIIGAPGSDPKMALAVMGDGYAEEDMVGYRQVVAERVLPALRLDRFEPHQAALRVVRIDVVSPVSGVTERRYDEKGTPSPVDDTVTSEDFRFSRLGFVATGAWSHCWIEDSARTGSRIESLLRRFAPEARNVIVIVNSATAGGCNRGTIAAFTRGASAAVIAHELGHNLFRLDDEYHNDERTFTGTSNRVNTSEEPASWDTLKWVDLVAANTPLPTDEDNLPAGWNRRTSVGAFEGGGAHYSRGIFRPVLECRMNQNNPPWCPVCGREIERILGEFE